jgi:hypothetical protein
MHYLVYIRYLWIEVENWLWSKEAVVDEHVLVAVVLAYWVSPKK